MKRVINIITSEISHINIYNKELEDILIRAAKTYYNIPHEVEVEMDFVDDDDRYICETVNARIQITLKTNEEEKDEEVVS